MRKFFLPIFISLITTGSIISQTKATISDVDFRIENNKIVVVYNITGYLPGETFTIGLSFVTGDYKTINPVSVFGDVGQGIPGGSNKSIIWNIDQENFILTGSLKAVVRILSASTINANPPINNVSQPSKKPLGGPGYAFLSMVLPGTGGYFVEENKTRAIIFNVVGGVVLISMIASVVEINDLNKQYDAASPADKPGIQTEIDYAEQWFRDAGTVYAAIMLTDVLWVAIKGGKNKAKQRAGSGLTLNYSDNRLMAGYRLNF